jgi:hypothetical protein
MFGGWRGRDRSAVTGPVRRSRCPLGTMSGRRALQESAWTRTPPTTSPTSRPPLPARDPRVQLQRRVAAATRQAGDIEHLSLPQGRLLFSRASLDVYIERIRVKAEAS